MTSVSSPLTPQRISASEIYGPRRAAREAFDRSKVAGKPSGLVAEYRHVPKVPPMSYDRPTYHIVKLNEALPGCESAKDLIYSGSDDPFAHGARSPPHVTRAGRAAAACCGRAAKRHVSRAAVGSCAYGCGLRVASLAGERNPRMPLLAEQMRVALGGHAVPGHAAMPAPSHGHASARPRPGLRSGTRNSLGPPAAPAPSIFARQPHAPHERDGPAMADGDPGCDADAQNLASEGEPHGTALGVPVPHTPASPQPGFGGLGPQPRNTMPLGTSRVVLGSDWGPMAKANHARSAGPGVQ